MKYTDPLVAWVINGTEHRGQGNMIAAHHPHSSRHPQSQNPLPRPHPAEKMSQVRHFFRKH
jgi:hypothetical protein